MNPTTTPRQTKLVWRLVGRCLKVTVGIAALLFGSAGSVKYWQGWTVLMLELSFASLFCIYFYQRDPRVLERRLLKKEPLTAQKLIIVLWKTVGAAAFCLAGFDRRFGWSGAFLEPVPLWLELLSFLFLLSGYSLLFQVMKANRFAASVIQIEAGQSVAATGPYARVRHPMYLAFALTGLSTPLALGSFIAFLVSGLVVPIIIFRLLNEEKLLRRELPGYADYCERTRYRLVPLVW